MKGNYEVDYEQLKDYVKWLASFDIGGLAVNVDTGEGPQLYPEEKLQIVRLVSEAVRGRLPIVSGLQARNTEEAVKSASEAKGAGANAVLVFPHQAFFGEPSTEVIYDYHREISERANVPIILFNLQQALGGVEYSPETVRRLIEIENVIGIKEASFDAKKFLEVARTLSKAPRRITLLTGNDDFIYESLVLGADGGLLGFGTIAVKEQVEMFDLVGKKRYSEARTIWEEKLLPLEKVLLGPPVGNYRARLKEALVMLGVIRTAFVRPPLKPIPSEEREVIRSTLKKLQML